MRTLALCICLCAAAPGLAQSSKPDTYGWQFEITPYLWLPAINGTFQFGTPDGSSPQVGVGADQYLQNLDFAFMFSGEARRGSWVVLTDLIYLDFSGQTATVRTVTGPGGMAQTPVNASTQSGLKGLVWELAVGYTVVHGGATTMEVLGGFRYLGLEASVDWQLAGGLGLFPQAGSFSQKEDLWDVIVGVRGKSRLPGGRWFIPYYFDIGSGSSVTTWQAAAGIGYSFKWGDALLAYRHLEYQQQESKLLQDLSVSGPALGVTFRF